MKPPLFFNSHDADSDEALKLLREANVDFVEIFANDADEPTLITGELPQSFKGLEEIKFYISAYYE